MSNNDKAIRWIAFGAVICSLYVLLGAFGAHGLEGKLSDSQLSTYNTALRYLVIHGLGLIIVNLSYVVLHKSNKWVNWLFTIGLVLFSLSLLIHSTKHLLGIEINLFALVAPLGGLSFVAGWILYALVILRK